RTRFRTCSISSCRNFGPVLFGKQLAEYIVFRDTAACGTSALLRSRNRGAASRITPGDRRPELSVTTHVNTAKGQLDLAAIIVLDDSGAIQEDCSPILAVATVSPSLFRVPRYFLSFHQLQRCRLLFPHHSRLANQTCQAEWAQLKARCHAHP